MNQQNLKYKRIVIKVGSNLLTGGAEQLNEHVIADIARQIAALKESGCQCILVSSGAVAAGKSALGIKKIACETQTRQLCAAVGQGRLMHLYERNFEQYNIIVAQALLGKRDFVWETNDQTRSSYLNARNTLTACLERNLVCIVNENDVTSIEELKGHRFGDNDTLSALVANMVDADLLLILSDVEGLYDRNPHKYTDAQLINKVVKIDEAIIKAATSDAGARGTGGMITKVKAAKTAGESGIPTIITKGSTHNAILNVCSDNYNGTYFAPSSDRLESKKRYLTSGLTVCGQLIVDSGAAKALKEKGSSLLPKGIIAISGIFASGNVVAIVNQQGQIFGYGYSNYSAAEVDKIKGQHSKDIINILGLHLGDEVIHANNLVITEKGVL